MTKGNPNKSKSLGAVINEVLREKGLALPETEDEVAVAEAELANDKEPLPTALHDPWGFLNPKARLGVTPTPAASAVSPEVTQELARAARSAGTMSKEVEERMRRDREEAEAQAKNEKK